MNDLGRLFGLLQSIRKVVQDSSETYYHKMNFLNNAIRYFQDFKDFIQSEEFDKINQQGELF